MATIQTILDEVSNGVVLALSAIDLIERHRRTRRISNPRMANAGGCDALLDPSPGESEEHGKPFRRRSGFVGTVENQLE